MILINFLSTLLMTAPFTQSQALEIIRESHLDTTEGRLTFLEKDLMEVLQIASDLNGEIDALSREISALDETEADRAVLLTTEMTQKMDRMLVLLPILQEALSVEENLDGLDELLAIETLSDSQLSQLRQLAQLCHSLKGIR